jgi:DNA polymerase-4
MNRTILHCDCNGFYASVECILNPELKKVPMAVCGDPENRHGIILAKNELAKKYNVKTAETIWQAKKKCPNLILVPPHHDKYAYYSDLINKIYEDYTELIEPFGIDESWLDVTGTMHLFGSGRTIADNLRNRIRNEIGLTISVGVSFNKVFAKLGSDYKKPDATTVITPENYKDIVYPLPVSDLLFVGKSSKKILSEINIKTIGDLAQSDKFIIISKLGKMGEMLYNYANGKDNSLVKSISDAHEIKSVGNGMTFKRDLLSTADIQTGVFALADTVATRMRRYDVKCTALQVMIKNPDFKTISRQKQLANPSNLAKQLAEAAMEIISCSWDIKNPIRMITITGINLIPADFAAEQLSLFENCNNEKYEKQQNLETAIDKIREKLGNDAIFFGSIINNDLGIHEKDK